MVKGKINIEESFCGCWKKMYNDDVNWIIRGVFWMYSIYEILIHFQFDKF